MFLTKNISAYARCFFIQRCRIDRTTSQKLAGCLLSYLDFIRCFAPGVSWVLTALLVTTKSHFWNASAIRERIMSADCSSVEIGAERIERTSFPPYSHKYIYLLRMGFAVRVYGRLRIALLDKSCTIGFRRDAIWYIAGNGIFRYEREKLRDGSFFSNCSWMS